VFFSKVHLRDICFKKLRWKILKINQTKTKTQEYDRSRIKPKSTLNQNQIKQFKFKNFTYLNKPLKRQSIDFSNPILSELFKLPDKLLVVFPNISCGLNRSKCR